MMATGVNHFGRSIIFSLFFVLFCVPGIWAFSDSKVEELRKKGLNFEGKQQWSHACAVYHQILKHQPDNQQIRGRYLHCLRRFYQVRRHADDSFTKEVLNLGFAHSMRFYEFMLNYLTENSLDYHELTPEDFYRKGLEEFELALADPAFQRTHLSKASAQALQEFRAALVSHWANQPVYNIQDATTQVRELAKAALRKLKLQPTVTVMEFTCGSCYAVDDYTMYLSPGDLRKLYQALKGDFVNSVKYEMISKEDNIGYLAISEFSETTLPDMDDALVQLNKMGMKALILDLRDNRGGLVEPAIETARRFLSSGIIVSVQTAGSKTIITYQSRNSEALTFPMVVLVDSGTASAAEILAGALKENGRARLVGQITYGKGCIQELYRLAPPKGEAYPGGLRLTISRFFSPSGVAYSGKGIIPDVPAEPPASPSEKNTDDDPQLQAALLELQQVLIMVH